MRAGLAALVLMASAAMADDDTPRLRPIAPVPEAMATHFGVDEANCYALATGQVTGPLDWLLIAQQFDAAARAEFAARGEYFINLAAHGTNPFADGPPLAQTTGATCRIRAAHLHCFIDGDGGRFDLYDAGYSTVLLRVYGIAGAVEDIAVPTDSFVPARYGAAFLLDRLPQAACRASLHALGYE